MPPRTDHPFASVLRNIRRASNPFDIRSERDRLPALTRRLIAEDVPIGRLTRCLSEVGEATLRTLIRRSLEELGPAPVGFTFMVMGSLCRREQTLKADQDNAIVYRDGSPQSERKTHAYFLALGDAVCKGLDDAGYAFCRGDFMARNPEWCRPLEVWKGYYNRWIQGFDPEAQVRFGMFFDFRSAFGERALIRELRAHLRDVLADSRGFFYHLARIAGKYEMPLGRFGNLKTHRMQGFHDLMDIKAAAEPLVFITRLLAYENGIERTHNTLSRLTRMGEQGVLESHICRSLIQAYMLLTRLRLKNQMDRGGDESLSDNWIRLTALNAEDRFMLKEALRAVRRLQREV